MRGIYDVPERESRILNERGIWTWNRADNSSIWIMYLCPIRWIHHILTRREKIKRYINIHYSSQVLPRIIPTNHSKSSNLSTRIGNDGGRRRRRDT